MALSILVVVVIFFSIRGFFLGFVAVIARLLGIMLGYYVAFSYRYPLAEFIDAQTSLDSSPLFLQIATGAGLFFSTLFITSLIVSAIVKLISKLIPSSRELFDRQSPASRVFGSGCNGLLGATIVLIGLWGYGLLIDSPNPPDPLQKFANQVGDSLLSSIIFLTEAASDETPSP
jgi:uncharacterized membrane protein required for colicin V production